MKIISEGHGEDWSLKIKCECVLDNFGFSYDSDKEHCGSILEIDKDDVMTREWFKYPDLEGTDYVVVCPKCQCCLYLNPSLLPDWVKSSCNKKYSSRTAKEVDS